MGSIVKRKINNVMETVCIFQFLSNFFIRNKK